MPLTYDAFISYSHAADGKLAPALQDALQRFAKPWYRLRALHLFRDQTSLSATPGLWPAIETALQNSRYFLLLASPEAAQSRWVQQEVAWWLEHKSPQTMLIALTEGKIARPPGAKDFDWEATDALPPNLKGVFSENPLWVDFRWAKSAEHLSAKTPEFQNALAALAAPLRGLNKEDLIGEDVRQHRRALLLARGGAIALFILSVVSIAVAGFALRKGHEATEQARIAAMRGLSAESARQSSAGKDELAALLARQAYLTSQRSDDSLPGQLETWLFGTPLDHALLGSVDESLRGALGVPHFAGEVFRQAGTIDRVAYSADGTLFAAGGTVFAGDPTGGAGATSNGRVWVWRLPNVSGPPEVLSGGPGRLNDLSISPDGQHIVAVGSAAGESGGGIAWLWDIQHPEAEPEVLTTCGGDINAVAFSADGRWFAAGGTSWESGSAPVQVWDIHTLGDPACLSYGATDILSLAFNPVLPEIAVGDVDGRIWLGNPTGTQPPVLFDKLAIGANALAFSPDGKQLAAAIIGGEVAVWDLATPDRPARVRQEDSRWVGSLAFSPDSQTLAIGGINGRVYLRDLTDADPVVPTDQISLDMNVMSVAFADDGAHLAVGGTRLNPSTGSIWLVNLGPPASAPRVLETPANLRGFRGPIAFTEDSQTLTAVSADLTVLRWDLGDTSAAPERVTTLTEGDVPVAFSPDASTLAVQHCVDHDVSQKECMYSEVRLLDLSLPGIPAVVLAAPATSADMVVPSYGSIVPGAFSPDGSMLAMGGAVGRVPGGRIALWDVRHPERPPQVLAGHQGGVTSVAFSPDGLSLASAVWVGSMTGDTQGEARLWDLRDLAAGSRLLGSVATGVRSIGFRPDGLAIIASGNYHIWIWDVDNLEGPSTVVDVAPGDVIGATFSPDGTLLAAGSVKYEDARVGLMWLWYLGNRMSAAIPLAADKAPSFDTVAFSPDGTFLAALGSDGKIRLWSARTSTLSDLVCATVLHNMNDDDWSRYVGTDGPAAQICPDLPPAVGSTGQAAT